MTPTVTTKTIARRIWGLPRNIVIIRCSRCGWRLECADPYSAAHYRRAHTQEHA